MPSQISNTLAGYKKSLDDSQCRYESMYTERAHNTKKFYDLFFNSLIRQYTSILEDRAGRALLKDKIIQFFGSEDVRFAAIDGTCYKNEFGDYMIFFGAAYSVRGNISFRGDPPITRYERWSPEQDVSMVAYIPVPFAELGDIAEEQFVVSPDTDKVTLASIHTQLMLLAEIYLAYDLISASTLRPKLLLWDQSMSGVLASTDIGIENVNMVGYEFMGRHLEYQDIIVAYSHPYNEILDIPSKKKFRFYNKIIMETFLHPTMTLTNLAKKLDLQIGDIKKALQGGRMKDYLIKSPINTEALLDIDETTDKITINRKYRESWSYVISFFTNICTRLFKEKDQSALIYEKEIDGEVRERWMSPNDLRFLIAVGLRALIEQCWKHNILFIGIAKDSASKYLSRNYLGAMRANGMYSFSDKLLPWTDRTFLELIPIIDDSINAPWSTIEFDSVFMTLAFRLSQASLPPRIAGVHGDVVNTERLFVRSLAQFYVNRLKPTPLCGHAIFVDRLVYPSTDRTSWGNQKLEGSEIGKIEPIIYKDKEVINVGQDLTIYFLDILTKNLYPEVIGYPDPLHKADWGAKSIRKKVKAMIDSSGPELKTKPLSRTFRHIRDSLRRV
jgi:hypothetical protein